MRLFVALDIDDTIRGQVARFLDGVRGFVPDARWARPESLHVTLKFIGEKSEDVVGNIRLALETIVAKPVQMNIRGYGFFPGTRRPRVFWIGIESGAELAALATTVDEKLAEAAIPKEEHAFSPHLTLARGAGNSGSPRKQMGGRTRPSFQHLQEKLAARPKREF